METVIIDTGIYIGTYVSVQIPVVSKSISSGKKLKQVSVFKIAPICTIFIINIGALPHLQRPATLYVASYTIICYNLNEYVWRET